MNWLTGGKNLFEVGRDVAVVLQEEAGGRTRDRHYVMVRVFYPYSLYIL